MLWRSRGGISLLLFGTQSGDAEKAMNEYEDELKCAGFLTAAGILFPEMDEDMSFEEFLP